MNGALISGINSQDGSYLTELLPETWYEVHGRVRRTSTFNTDRIDHLYVDPHLAEACMYLHYPKLSDTTGLGRVLEEIEPDEVNDLGAQTHVAVSFQQPDHRAHIDGLGALAFLATIRDYHARHNRELRLCPAGSSEGSGAGARPQSETTPFQPHGTAND